MLESLTSTPFAACIGENLTVEAAEAELALEILAVNEKPEAAGPNSKRIPFSVMLRGPDSPCLAEGCYNLRMDGEEGLRIEGIYLNRILPSADTDGTGAFYQAIFG